MTFTVRVTDLYNVPHEEATDFLTGFASQEEAVEYARRRTRDNLESMRKPGQTLEELRTTYLGFGEACGAGEYYAPSELDYFLANVATREERDWQALEPKDGRWSQEPPSK